MLENYYPFIDTKNALNCLVQSQSYSYTTQAEHQQKKSGSSEWSLDVGSSFSAGGPIPIEDVIVNFQATRTQSFHADSKDEWVHETKFFKEMKGEIYQESSVCQLYKLSINEYNKPYFTTGFKNAVQKLYDASAKPDDPASEDEVKKFWDQYGTHYLSEVYLGGSLSAESRWASSAVTSSDRSER